MRKEKKTDNTITLKDSMKISLNDQEYLILEKGDKFEILKEESLAQNFAMNIVDDFDQDLYYEQAYDLGLDVAYYLDIYRQDLTNTYAFEGFLKGISDSLKGISDSV